MGTFVLKGFSQQPQFGGDWTDGGSTYDMSGPTTGYGTILLALSSGFLYLDGSGSPTSYDNLPEDFGINLLTNGSLFFNTDNDPGGVDIIPPVIDESDIGIFAGGVANFDWSISPLSIRNINMPGIVQDHTVFQDPEIATAPPLVLTKWNGLLAILLAQGQLQMTFARTSLGGPNPFNVSVLKNESPYLWEMRGEYGSYPPPPNVIYMMTGGIDLGGAATQTFLNDASGIYTLIPGQYHDELYQRIGTTSSTTVNVMIPEPFFKTGFIGG